MRGVRRVAPVAAAGRDHVDRRRPLLHRPDLVGRRVRAQNGRVVEVEGVELRARRMAGIARQRVEVLPDGCDLGPVPDLVAHAEEDVLDLAPDLRQQVQPPAANRVAGNRDVETGAGGRLVDETQQILLPRRHRLLEPRPDAVQEHPALPVAHGAERLGELRLAAEVLDARVVELRFRQSLRDGAQRFGFIRGPTSHRGETIQGSSFTFDGADNEAPVRRRSARRRPRLRTGAG